MSMGSQVSTASARDAPTAETLSDEPSAAPDSPVGFGLDAAASAPFDGPITPEKLALLFHEFSETTRKLQDSQGVLERRVVELHAELNEKNRLLERKKRLEGLGLMVAGVAHEIRNPLGSISLYLDCLDDEIGADNLSKEECRGLVARIEEAIAHLDSVVQNMLVFAGQSAARRVPCDLKELVHEAIQLLRKDFDSTRTTCELVWWEDLGGDDGVVTGDADQIRVVILNVFKNAIQAMKTEGHLRVSLGEACHGDSGWRLSVCDNGPGIPAENFEKVFVPFFTDGSKKGGVGLGLTIVHSLMERQGGRVELANLESSGLEVTLIFSNEGPLTEGTSQE